MSLYCTCDLVSLGVFNFLKLCYAALHGRGNFRTSDRRLQNPMAKTEICSLKDR